MKKILITIILLTNLPVAAATGYTPAHILTISLITNQCIFNSNKNSGWQQYQESKYKICTKYNGGNACQKYRESTCKVCKKYNSGNAIKYQKYRELKNAR